MILCIHIYVLIKQIRDATSTIRIVVINRIRIKGVPCLSVLCTRSIIERQCQNVPHGLFLGLKI